MDKLLPYPFDVNGSKEVYLKINSIPIRSDNFKNADKFLDDRNSEDDVVHISLINRNMLEYDAEFFGQGNHKEYYRPYFYEFYVSSNNLSPEALLFLEENKDKMLVGKFDSDGYLKEEGFFLDGNIFFSASPFQVKRRTILITHNEVPLEVRDKYAKTYDTSSTVVSADTDRYEKMCDILNNTMNSYDYSTRIYNVGQGNCIYIRSSAKKRILFDIGYNKTPGSTDWLDSNIIKSKRSIMRIKPHLTILSHWDMDHIIGVAFAQDLIFEQPWIAPDLNELKQVSIGAARLAKYLSWKGQLFLVGSDFLGEEVSSGFGYKLWRGNGKNNCRNPHGGLNKANNFGLIIELIGTKRMLLSGDCEYKSFPTELDFSRTRFNFLIVPHHCSKMELVNISTTSCSEDYAIISVGQNSYTPHHPYEYHKQHLIRGMYNMLETNNNWYIDINSLNKFGNPIVRM